MINTCIVFNYFHKIENQNELLEHQYGVNSSSGRNMKESTIFMNFMQTNIKRKYSS